MTLPWRCCLNLFLLSLILPKCECFVCKSVGCAFENSNKRDKRSDPALNASLSSIIPAGKNELSEAKCEKTGGNGAEGQVSKRDLPRTPYWLVGTPGQRLEIHPGEGRVTLAQIENECEESMRKQFKENQHKKKLQFNLLGKRNDTSVVELENILKASDLPQDMNVVGSNSSSIEELKDKKEIIEGLETFKRGTLSGVASRIKNLTETATKLNGSSSELTSSVNNLGSETSIVSENKVARPASMKGVNIEDQDVKLLKILYQVLNSQQRGFKEVEPLVQALKDIAETKEEMNEMGRNKPVSQKMDNFRNVNSLLKKISEYKSKHNEKRLYDNQYGSSPLNPNLINNREFSTLFSKNVFKSRSLNELNKDRKHIFNFSTNSNPASKIFINPCKPDITFEPKPTIFEFATDLGAANYSNFVSLIDKILTNMNNGSQTSNLFQNLNRQLSRDENDQPKNEVLAGLVEEMARNDVALRDCDEVLENDDEWKEIVRNPRAVKILPAYKNADEQFGNITYIRQIKSPNDQACTFISSQPKNLNKSGGKSDELRRLHKVASELKAKIDDLLNNLEGTIGDDDDDEDEDDEDDEDDEEDEAKEQAQAPVRVQQNSRMSKPADDAYDSFKKYKPPTSDVLSKEKTKTVAKKNNGVNEKVDKSKSVKTFSKVAKAKRDKRDRGILAMYYKSRNFSKPRKNVDKSKDDLSDGIKHKYNPITLLSAMDDENLSNTTTRDYFQNNITFKKYENNFDVFKAADEFKQSMHQNGDSELEKDNNYFSNFKNDPKSLMMTEKNVINSIVAKPDLNSETNIKSIYSRPRLAPDKNLYLASYNKNNLIHNDYNTWEQNDIILSNQNTYNKTNNLMMNIKNESTKYNQIQQPNYNYYNPQWLEDTRINISSPSEVENEIGNQDKNNLQLLNKSERKQLYRFSRSLQNFLNYFKPKGKKDDVKDDKVIFKPVAAKEDKEMRLTGVTENFDQQAESSTSTQSNTSDSATDETTGADSK